jgi:two-component system, NtrC family, sensor kinase
MAARRGKPASGRGAKARKPGPARTDKPAKKQTRAARTTPSPAPPTGPPAPPPFDPGGAHTPPPLPVLSAPPDVLRAVMTFSREVTAETQERELLELLYRTLRQLLPGRWVAIRIVEPRSLEVTEILAEGALVASAGSLPPMIPRSALDYPSVRRNMPESLVAKDGSGRRIEVADTPPLLFERAAAGFVVALVAGGELTGEVHVNYPAVPGPGIDDKDLVIPLANHAAVVVHTRRLLRETVYLQDYLEQLIEQANALIIATDTEGRVTVWNRAMNRVTGFSRGEVVGKPLLPWLTQLGVPDVGRVLKQVAASSTPATREVRLPTVGGAMLRAAFNVVAVRGPAGTPAAVLGIGQDVTALRQLQSQVIHAEKLATVGQIAAGVAHEINNPLTSIQVCASTVARKAGLAIEGKGPPSFDSSDLDRLKKIEEGAERIRRFARDLVSYARPSGREVEDISVNEVLDQALSFCEHVLESAHAALERDYARDLPRIQAVRDQVLQVAINLITNAAHAVEPRGGTVRVRTWAAGGASVGFAISDNGVGIKDEDRPKIFDPFFTTKPAGRGTGLGLSIVRNIIYSHGGQISFQSRPGSGTTFMVTLPVTPLGPPEHEGGMPPI